ncbi:MAG: TonB-dependent receptor [Halioglobus sp.]
MKFTTLAAGSATLLLASVAFAEVPALEEIIVTAEFRDTPLMQQSSSTSVFSAKTIQQRSAQHLEDILNLAPNVNYASGASRARFFQVRGIGERSQFQEPLNSSIGFLIDGVDFSGLGTVATLFDVQQVEVLRGPQGTLHGANALAGLINIRTGSPEAEPSLRLEATLADYDTYSLGVVGTGPLVQDTLLYRLAIQTYQSDGFIENDFLDKDDTNSRDETSVRGKLRWLPSADDTVELTLLYADVDNGYDAFSLDNTRHTLSDEPGHDRQESTALAINWQHDWDTVTIESALSVAQTETDYAFDEDWSYVGIAPGWEYSSFDQYLRDRDSYNAELRLLSSEDSRVFGGTTDWTTGIYYLGNREQLTRRYTYLESDFRSDYDTDTLAVFGQLDSALSDHLTLITGLRYENRATDYSDNNGVDSDPDNNLWGGKIALEYMISDTAMTYASVSRGYRANGINANILASLESVDNPDDKQRLNGLKEFDEEYLLNYELGYKASYLQSRLNTRIALFYMDRKDQQVKGSEVIDRDDGSTAFIDYTSNAAEGNNYGVELEVDWMATERLALNASLGLLETEFEDYTNADGVDLSGREQAHAPSYQYAIGARYDFGSSFYARADIEGKDTFYFSDRHDVRAPSQDLLNMRVGYDAENWAVSLWGRNLTDEEYYVRGFGSFGNDPRKEYITEPYYQYGEPRMIGVSGSYNF